MFKSKESKLHFVYSFGATIVILGAFFKMTHVTLGGIISPNFVLGAGLLTEAVIFFISAFNPPREEEHYAWENVYPELLDNNAVSTRKSIAPVQSKEIKEIETSLSAKLDELLKDAKLDVSLFERLRNGIEHFSVAVDQINKTVDISASTNKYNEELGKAASHMENLNALYALQLENGKSATGYQSKYVADLQKSSEYSEKFNEALQGLTANIGNLNRVYGGMLNAMKS